MPEIPDLTELALASPWTVRTTIGLVSAILLVGGARIYKPGMMLAAFASGGLVVCAALVFVGAVAPAVASPTVLTIGAVAGGAAAAWVAHLAHKIALVAVGAVAGLTISAAVLPWIPGEPLWMPIVGLLIGGASFPWIYPALLKLFTPAVGAVGIAWAAGMPDTAWLLGGLWAFGAAVQLVGPGGTNDNDGEEEE